MHNPSPLNWQRVKHFLRYLKGTIFDNLFYSTQSTLSLEVFSDVDWASSPLDRRYTWDYLAFLGRNLASWSSRKQRTISRSSTEAEYEIVADATAELTWIKSLLHELQLQLSTYLAVNPVFHAQTKHVKIDYHFVREQVTSQQLRVGYLSTKDQVADILTKPLKKISSFN